MAEDVKVKINDAMVISALNTPGGDVYDWRNDVEEKLLTRVYRDSPVNDILDAMHRGGVVGEFQTSWVTRRWGNGHRVGFNIENFSDHALYVEEGRSASGKFQAFSWGEWGGETRWVGANTSANRRRAGGLRRGGRGTGEREGYHVLRDAANRVLTQATGGAYTPLV